MLLPGRTTVGGATWLGDTLVGLPCDRRLPACTAAALRTSSLGDDCRRAQSAGCNPFQPASTYLGAGSLGKPITMSAPSGTRAPSPCSLPSHSE